MDGMPTEALVACGRSGLPLLAVCRCGRRRLVPFRLLQTSECDRTSIYGRPFHWAGARAIRAKELGRDAR